MKKAANIFLAFGVAIMLSASPPSQAIVSGTVTDTMNDPVPHALVTFTNESDSTQFRAVTDSLGQFQIDIAHTAVEDTPATFTLGQNYPNPFNPSTTIPFTLDAPGNVTLTIYNIMGQRVRTLIDEYRTTGHYSIVWDGRDTSGNGVATGIYFYQLRSNDIVQTKKMLLLDGGGTQTHSSHEAGAAKQTTGQNLYSVTVERFGYNTYRQERIDVSEKILHYFTMQDSGELVPIPGGTFQMGDVEDAGTGNELPVHPVTLSEFEISVYEITNAQYAAYLNAGKALGDITATSSSVISAKGAYNNQEYIYLAGWDFSYPDARCWITYSNNAFNVVSGHENWPVVYVTWYGSKAFATYYGFDLPTEAEWEYACRGGRQYKYGTDDGTYKDEGTVKIIYKANCYDLGIKHPVQVGSYSKPPFGLYDISGNVVEWCQDWYGWYPSGSVTNPMAGVGTGTGRVVRGGGWNSPISFCRSAYRTFHAPDGTGYYRRDNLGFRVVRRPGGLAY